MTIDELKRTHLGDGSLGLEVRCSKGTYVRTLVEDVAKALGTRGHVIALRRTGVAGFDTEDKWVTLEELEAAESPETLLLGADAALRGWPAMTLSPDLVHFFRHGQPVMLPRAPLEGWLCVYDKDHHFLGVGEVLDDGRVAPRRLIKAAAA